MALKICLRLDEKFEKFEHNFAGLGMEMAEMYKEYAKLKAEFCGQIALLENEVKKLKKENCILKSRLMNNAAEEEQVFNIIFES
jgi:hypothetical protein